MSRTDKQGIARSKQLQQKFNRIKGLNMQPFYANIAKKSLQQAKDDGDIYVIVNPLGHTFHWYRRGRKSCFETGLKIDPDGYNRWGFI